MWQYKYACLGYRKALISYGARLAEALVRSGWHQVQEGESMRLE